MSIPVTFIGPTGSCYLEGYGPTARNRTEDINRNLRILGSVNEVTQSQYLYGTSEFDSTVQVQHNQSSFY